MPIRIEDLDINELSESYRTIYKTLFWLYLSNACLDKKELTKRIKSAKESLNDILEETFVCNIAKDKGASVYDPNYLFARALTTQDEISLLTKFRRDLSKCK